MAFCYLAKKIIPRSHQITILHRSANSLTTAILSRIRSRLEFLDPICDRQVDPVTMVSVFYQNEPTCKKYSLESLLQQQVWRHFYWH